MTSIERVYALYQAVQYVIKNNIPGDFVECGVWRGGSTMAIALTLNLLNNHERSIYLYDTFTGMTEPEAIDIDVNGYTAEKQFKETPKMCYAGLDEVRKNLSTAGYPSDKLIFVEGPVEETIPATLPNQICLLRLDTDWYNSTLHELQHLFPALSNKGVLIIDDYGHWQGAKKAVDQYFTESNIFLLLNRIDYTGRIAIKM